MSIGNAYVLGLAYEALSESKTTNLIAGSNILISEGEEETISVNPEMTGLQSISLSDTNADITTTLGIANNLVGFTSTNSDTQLQQSLDLTPTTIKIYSVPSGASEVVTFEANSIENTVTASSLSVAGLYTFPTSAPQPGEYLAMGSTGLGWADPGVITAGWTVASSSTVDVTADSTAKTYTPSIANTADISVNSVTASTLATTAYALPSGLPAAGQFLGLDTSTSTVGWVAGSGPDPTDPVFDSLTMGSDSSTQYKLPVPVAANDGQVLTYKTGGQCVFETISTSGDVVVGSNAIEVDTSTPGTATVSLKKSADADNAVDIRADGLFVASNPGSVTYSDGLVLTGSDVKVLIDPSSSSDLTVGPAGVKLTSSASGSSVTFNGYLSACTENFETASTVLVPIATSFTPLAAIGVTSQAALNFSFASNGSTMCGFKIQLPNYFQPTALTYAALRGGNGFPFLCMTNPADDTAVFDLDTSYWPAEAIGQTTPYVQLLGQLGLSCGMLYQPYTAAAIPNTEVPDCQIALVFSYKDFTTFSGPCVSILIGMGSIIYSFNINPDVQTTGVTPRWNTNNTSNAGTAMYYNSTVAQYFNGQPDKYTFFGPFWYVQSTITADSFSVPSQYSSIQFVGNTDTQNTVYYGSEAGVLDTPSVPLLYYQFYPKYFPKLNIATNLVRSFTYVTAN